MLKYLILVMFLFESMNAQSGQQEKEKLVDQYFEIRHWSEQIKGIGGILSTSFDAAFTSASSKYPEKVRNVLRSCSKKAESAFDKEFFFRKFKSKFIELINEKDLTEEINDSSSPEAKKTLELEKAADLTSKEGREKLKLFTQVMESHRPNHTRIEIAKQLDDASQSTESVVLGTISAIEEFQKVEKAFFPENKNVKIFSDKELAVLRSRLYATHEANTIATFLYIYKDLDDSEFKKMAKSASLPFTKSIAKTMHDSLVYAFAAASSEYARLFAVEMKLNMNVEK